MLFCSLDYSTREYNKMEEAQQEGMREYWPGLQRKLDARKQSYPTKPEEWNNLSTWDYGTECRLTLEEAHGLERAGVKFSVEGIDGTMLQKQKSRADKYGEIHTLDLTSGQVVQIAVPDLGILQITEVDWIEDACTERLQEKLDSGWRILAVCPPNAQRRPDYILGRQKKEIA